MTRKLCLVQKVTVFPSLYHSHSRLFLITVPKIAYSYLCRQRSVTFHKKHTPPYIIVMAPTDINLGETRRWLAQLHTTNLPGPAPASSDSSTRSNSSADDSASPTFSSPGGIDPNTTTTAMMTSPLTESRAMRLQRLCEISEAAREAVPAGSVNACFTPNNINYISTAPSRWEESGQRSSPDAASPPLGRARWARKQSGQSLEELEGGSMRRFSLSRFRLR